ncbi:MULTISPECIES: YigZ family protein [unclassified Sporolactobacillus]|uniref:YigZ family protein n=1 Tax=unclassified Sporolactobacillus TaxID=2628533 RepID=UPI0023683749|nr:YigZ family protein [Sporolactobacillus sp. CQH2019]MDD9148041.1 YigZ family protein [Sporolactobacillus sp. CQH2019]
MTLSSYITVMHPAIKEIEIRRSRFIASVFPVVSENDAAAAIEAKRKEHWKANHHCFAYVIGKKQEIQKASDDGEPSGTAGVPILDVLKRRGLCDVLIIVTRYFGGIKLGAGGLIRAYAHAAGSGLAAAEVIEQIPADLWRTSVDYHLSGSIDNKLRESSYLVKNVQYTDKVSFDVFTRQEESSVYTNWIRDLTNGTADNKKIEELYLHKKLPEPADR